MERLKVAVYRIRGEEVILDSDLAALYGVKTARLNQQVKRNVERFPEDFAFNLTAEEKREVVAFCNNPEKLLYYRGLPKAFTEHGALMAATVLNSPVAARMGIFIVRAFVRMRRELAGNERISRKIAEMDKVLLLHDESLRDIYEKLVPLLEPEPESEKRKIGFQPGKGIDDRGWLVKRGN